MEALERSGLERELPALGKQRYSRTKAQTLPAGRTAVADLREA